MSVSTTVTSVRLLVTSRVSPALGYELVRFNQQVRLSDGLPTVDGVAFLRELDPSGECGLRDASYEALAVAVNRVHGVPRALEVLAGILANDPFADVSEVLQDFYRHDGVNLALSL